MAVVGDLQQLQAAFLDHDLQRAGPGIDCILDELFQRVHGGHDDLASRDLVDDVLVQGLQIVSVPSYM